MIKQDYSYFRTKFERIAEEKHIPLRALFELTYKCNFNCVHCYIPRGGRNKELNTNKVFSILEQLRDLGCFHLGFTGGEIYLRKDISRILLRAKKMGFNLTILTNASLIDKKRADELKEIAPIKVDITLHSLNPAHFEDITRLKGSFKETMKAIDLLRERDITLGIKNCILRENIGDYKDVQEFADKIKASSRIGAKVFASEQNSCQPGLGDSGFLEEILPAKFKKRKVFMCAVGKTALTISPAGELKFCPQIDYPNIKIDKTGLRLAWGNLVDMVETIEQGADLKCSSCRLKGHCNWCPAETWAAYKDLNHCRVGIFDKEVSLSLKV